MCGVTTEAQWWEVEGNVQEFLAKIRFKKKVWLQAGYRVSVTNLLDAKAGRMTGMRIVCPAEFSWGSRVNWVLPTVLLCLIKLILGLILPCLAALLSCWAECGREGNGSHAQKLVLQTKPGGQLW